MYATKVREAIGAKIGETRAELIKALLPRVKAAPPRVGYNGRSKDTLMTIRSRSDSRLKLIIP